MIREVTETLISIIHRETPDLGEWVTPISLHNTNAPTAGNLALFLYHIEEHAHIRNRPLEFDGDSYRRPPLMLRLCYLAAWFGNEGAQAHLDEQARLERLLQAFHSHPVIPASDLPASLGSVDQLSVRLWSPTIEEQNEVWTGLSQPMRLGLFYKVDAVPIMPTTRGGPPIVEQQIEYGEWVTS